MKNVLTKQFPKMQKQLFANVLQNPLSREVFCNKGGFRDFAKFIGKHRCQSLYINKVVGQGRQLYLKRDPGRGVSCEFCKISKNTFSHRIPLVAASSFSK